jgi:hypothetical protein
MNKKIEDNYGAIQELREVLKTGDIVYTMITHVSNSGMMRTIRTIIIRNNEPLDISYKVAKALGWNLNRKHDGITVNGCGMDMGFHVVYSLSSRLFPEGHVCIGEKCPSNDHSNGDRDYTPHNHKDGGYALIQKWL